MNGEKPGLQRKPKITKYLENIVTVTRTDQSKQAFSCLIKLSVHARNSKSLANQLKLKMLLLHLHHWPLALAITSCIVAASTTTTTATTTTTTTTTPTQARSTTTTATSASIPGKYQAYGSQHQPKKLRAGIGAAGNSSGSEPVNQFRQNPIKNWFGVFNRNNSPPAQDQTATCSCRWVNNRRNSSTHACN